jgi:arylsulfatase A-like enzyme
MMDDDFGRVISIAEVKRMRRAIIGGCLAVVVFAVAYTPARGQIARAPAARRNVIVVVLDGLRPGSVNVQDMPTLTTLRAEGVEFRNSHSLFPTVTMANASAIATGHLPGDTGISGNALWVRYPAFESGNFDLAPGTPTPFIENDQVLADLDDHFGGNVLGEDTLLALARAHGYQTAAIGKLGPAALQDAPALAPRNREMPRPSTIIVDDAAGTPSGFPLSPECVARIRKEGLMPEAPARSNGYGANSRYNNGRVGTLAANVVQQQWFADVATRVVLPMFEANPAVPFALVYWSRDPDGTQHNQGDSPGTLVPGINGPSSRLALQNADRNLRQLLSWLDAHPSVKANTDIFITSDHGFATASRGVVDRTGRRTTSEAARHLYVDDSGKADGEVGMLPGGFLAIDLALALRVNLFDQDRRVLNGGRSPYHKVRLTTGVWEHPTSGNGLLGDVVQKLDGSDAVAIVAANGGTDLIYVPDRSAGTVDAIVSALMTYDYVGAVFVDDRYGAVPGTLPLGAVGLAGASAVPRPDIVVAFKVFYVVPDDVQTAVQLADTTAPQGQGVHGGFGRDSTYNTMVAAGPDFKKAFVDRAPVSNADITPTLAHVLGFDLRAKGALRGRVAREALMGEPDVPVPAAKSLWSSSVNGVQTGLYYQELGGERYADTACRVLSVRQDTAAACR